MKNSNRKNMQWLRNPDQMKHPKVFNVKMLRLKDGSFQILGGETEVLIGKNQHSYEAHKVDTRDFTRELRRSKITSL